MNIVNELGWMKNTNWPEGLIYRAMFGGLWLFEFEIKFQLIVVDFWKSIILDAIDSHTCMHLDWEIIKIMPSKTLVVIVTKYILFQLLKYYTCYGI